MNSEEAASKPKFCSECGVRFLPDAKFCHNCGSPIEGGGPSYATGPSLPPALKWGLPGAAVLALIVIVFFRLGAKEAVSDSSQPAAPVAAGSGSGMPDIAAMSPEERADRLFNRVMSYASDGKKDSAAFFAPMALASIQAITPITAHSHYDMGLVELVSGDLDGARAQADTILSERPNHLLGLLLTAKVADARGDAAAAKQARKKLVAAEKSERAAGLPEYSLHDADLKAALDSAR